MATSRKSAKKAAPATQKDVDNTAALRARTGNPNDIRFEATLGPTPYAKALSIATSIDLDRLPDLDGKVRVLLTPDDARRLLALGVPVHLDKAHPIAPLPGERIMSDREAQRWLEQRMKGLKKQGGR